MLTHTVTHRTESKWIEVASRVPVIFVILKHAQIVRSLEPLEGTRFLSNLQGMCRKFQICNQLGPKLKKSLQVTRPFCHLLLFLAASTWFFRNFSRNTRNFVVFQAEAEHAQQERMRREHFETLQNNEKRLQELPKRRVFDVWNLCPKHCKDISVTWNPKQPIF